MPSLSHTITITIEFGDAVALEDLEEHKEALSKRGVYMLVDGSPEPSVHVGRNVFYIGKAVSETIFSRARKHVNSITGALLRTGNPKTRPGKKFRAFSEKVGKRLTGLHVVPGYMSDSEAFQVSCAEEWLLLEYNKKHGAIPEANTYSAKDL